jgi:hypothetical protein
MGTFVRCSYEQLVDGVWETDMGSYGYLSWPSLSGDFYYEYKNVVIKETKYPELKRFVDESEGYFFKRDSKALKGV